MLQPIFAKKVKKNPKKSNFCQKFRIFCLPPEKNINFQLGIWNKKASGPQGAELK